MTKLLNRTIELNCSLEHAFKTFTQNIDIWWPRTHRRDSKSTMILQIELHGRLFERSADGQEWTIGEIIDIVPTSRLEFNWFPGAPNAPTNVTIVFTGNEQETTITIQHKAITPDSISIWNDKIALFKRGWDIILPSLKNVSEA